MSNNDVISGLDLTAFKGLDDNPLPVLPEHKKGWLKSAPLDFVMQSCLPQYLELYESSPSCAKEYVTTAANDILRHFDFQLPLNVTPDEKYDPQKTRIHYRQWNNATGQQYC